MRIGQPDPVKADEYMTRMNNDTQRALMQASYEGDLSAVMSLTHKIADINFALPQSTCA